MKVFKNFALLFISTFVMQAAFAQPVITSNINLTIGDSYRYDGYDKVTNAEPGSPGANQIWNFADITGDEVLTGATYRCVDPSMTPFADSSAVQNADICTVDTNFNLGINYFYYVNSSSSQVMTAGGSITPNGDALYGAFSGDGYVWYEFPFTYNGSYDYSYEVMDYSISEGYYYHHDSSTVTVEADAYGTITSPVKTYQNTLRIKQTHHQYNWMKLNPGDDWMFIGDITQISYRWMTPGIKVPVMTFIEYEEPDEYTVHYLVEHNFTTGIEEGVGCQIELYPNPVTDHFTIQSDKAFNDIRLFSINGEQKNRASFRTNQTNRQTIDFSRYSKGVYLIELEFDDGTTVTEKIIKY